MAAHRILFVEDDRQLREIFVEILGDAGYQVTAAHDGTAGWAAVQAAHPMFDLVITDNRMPGMTGDELITAIRGAHPALPILCMSGAEREVQAGVALLYKPFLPEALLAAVKAALAR